MVWTYRAAYTALSQNGNGNGMQLPWETSELFDFFYSILNFLYGFPSEARTGQTYGWNAMRNAAL